RGGSGDAARVQPPDVDLAGRHAEYRINGFAPSCGSCSEEDYVPTTTAVAVVRGLTKRYGTRNAVDGVSFEIAVGECFALLGPNGAGKTTTLEIMQGIRTPTSGDVRVFGEDPHVAGRRWRSRI